MVKEKLSLKLSQLSHCFEPSRILFSPLDLQINYGDKVGIVGSNGIGKTTLLRIISTEIKNKIGSIEYYCGPTKSLQHTTRKHLSYAMAEDQSFFDYLNGQENLELFLSLRSSQVEMEKSLKEWIKIDNFKKSLATPYERCSSGMKKILSLYRCLAVEADIYILDEPTVHLDEASIQFLEKTLKNLFLSKTLIIASHDRAFLNNLNCKVILLEPK